MTRLSQPRTMASVLGRAQRLLKKSPSQPLLFHNSNLETITTSQKLEEESCEDFCTGRYCPVRIGEILNVKYQVVGKLGFGLGSTVWLANDLQ